VSATVILKSITRKPKGPSWSIEPQVKPMVGSFSSMEDKAEAHILSQGVNRATPSKNPMKIRKIRAKTRPGREDGLL
jgi:hypothetical protein